VIATALDPMTLYYLVYVLMACLSTALDYILPFFLLDVVIKNSYAMDVMIAVFYPIKQLSIAVVLFLFVMYIFGIAMFLEPSLNQGLVYPDDCESLWKCYKFVAGYGISADLSFYVAGLNAIWVYMVAFDLCIRYVIQNVVMGIIVDTFSELREQKIERLRDTSETCFICGFDRQVFERDKESEGFKVHVKREHCMWNYVYFIIYIWQQDKDDDDGLEQYVRRCIEANDISWMPINKAMCLSRVNEDDNVNVEIRQKFASDIENLRAKFSDELAVYQRSIKEAAGKIKQLFKKDEISRSNVDNVQDSFLNIGDSFAGGDAYSLGKEMKMATGRVTLLKKSMLEDRLHSLKGMTITIEVMEITGLTFDERLLNSLSCRIISKLGSVQVDCSHIMFQQTQSRVIFDPIEIIVCENYTLKDCDKMVIIQIARDSDGSGFLKYVAHCSLTLGDIFASAEAHVLVKSFSAQAGGEASMGSIRLNASAKNFTKH